ncbi:MAG: 16S rRNA methyltransferase [Gammaproteobacteria bacterium]|nr:MAG: 16S rRNA methyltransferase [Gammaproteobacteria bacterium]
MLSNPSQLVLRNESLFSGREVLLVGAPQDRLSQELGAETSVHWHWDWLAHQYVQQHGGRSHFGVEPPDGVFDVAIVFMPKAKSRLQYVLQQLTQILPAGHRAYLVGEKKEGTDSAGKWLATLGDGAQKIDRARHCILWEVTVQAQPVSRQDIATQKTLPIAGSGLSVAFWPGVFSEGRLDEGTALLLEHIPELPKGPVLDFACGSGVIASFLLKRQPALALTAVDCDAFALASTQATLQLNQQTGVVLPSDGFSALQGQRFSSIVTNPPFHEGFRTDMAMTSRFIRDMASHLVGGGELWLVANRFLPYAEALQETFATVQVAAENPRFVLYHARRG